MTVVIRFAWRGTSTSPCTPTFANLLASLLSCGRYTLHALPRHVCPESLASTYRPRWRCATCHTAYVTKAFRINRIRHPHPLRPFILSLSRCLVEREPRRTPSSKSFLKSWQCIRRKSSWKDPSFFLSSFSFRHSNMDEQDSFAKGTRK